MNILDKAIIFATEKHSGYFRKSSNIPYIVHPMEAGAIAATLTEDPEVISAALLHDVIEDTPTTAEDIRREFGDRVTALVLSDTENKHKEMPAEASWQLRKQDTLDFIANASREEQIICLSDKLSNIRAIYHDYNTIGDKIWQRFNMKDKQKQAWYYSGVAERLDKVKETDAYREYCSFVEKVFGNKK